MDATKTMIAVLFIMFPMLIKVQQALNLQDYSNYINRKKNEINEKLERARKSIDEFVIEIEASCEEFTCNFDVSLCGFEQGTDDKFNWTRHKGNTPSSGTGPSFDHTTGDMTGYFMYIEASSPRNREDNAKLYSPPLTFPRHMCLEFYYHMSGAAIGSLKVTINEKVVFSRSGDREDKWYKASINVSAIVGWHRVTFEGVVGNGYRGDIAIDDFSLTAGSCAFNCCSYHFEKYQDLPTSSAHAVEHFTINGDLFLAFANYKSDTTGKYNTDSFIYKFNDSTRKFSPYQNISTNGGQDVEYFKISDEHYLAVANGYNGVTHRLNSVIYRWNGKLFVAFQNLTTQGASGFSFFIADKEPFLAVSNLYDDVTNSTNSVIYRWKNKRFELFQEVATDGSNKSVAFLINNESYIAFANYVKDSVVYKWSGKRFFKLQTLPKANDLKFFNINDNAFLTISSPNENPLIYEWNGTQFGSYLIFLNAAGWGLHPFVTCGQNFLGLADRHNKAMSPLYIYMFSHGQFTKFQKISTTGVMDITSFEHKGHTYLAMANSGNDNQKNTESALYKWTIN